MTIYIAPKSKRSKAVSKSEKIHYKNKGAKNMTVQNIFQTCENY